jgi:hypothetical protein
MTPHSVLGGRAFLDDPGTGTRIHRQENGENTRHASGGGCTWRADGLYPLCRASRAGPESRDARHGQSFCRAVAPRTVPMSRYSVSCGRGSLCFAPTTTVAYRQSPRAFLVFHGVRRGVSAHFQAISDSVAAIAFVVASTKPTASSVAAVQQQCFVAATTALRRRQIDTPRTMTRRRPQQGRRPAPSSTPRQRLEASPQRWAPCSKPNPTLRNPRLTTGTSPCSRARRPSMPILRETDWAQ